MCPACMSSVALLATGTVTAGGIAALIARLFFWRRWKKPSHYEPKEQHHEHDID